MSRTTFARLFSSAGRGAWLIDPQGQELRARLTPVSIRYLSVSPYRSHSLGNNAPAKKRGWRPTLRRTKVAPEECQWCVHMGNLLSVAKNTRSLGSTDLREQRRLLAIALVLAAGVQGCKQRSRPRQDSAAAMAVIRARITNCWNDTTRFPTDSARLAAVLSCVTKVTGGGGIHVVGIIREPATRDAHRPVRDSARAKLPSAIPR